MSANLSNGRNTFEISQSEGVVIKKRVSELMMNIACHFLAATCHHLAPADNIVDAIVVPFITQSFSTFICTIAHVVVFHAL